MSGAVAPAVSVGQRVSRTGLTLIWLGAAVASTYSGLAYYLTPLQDRAYSDLHDVFAPSGIAGNAFGIAGSAMMLVGVVSYSLRKRSSLLARFGPLSYWLQFHIFLCTLGPFFVLLHTSFKFGGIISIAFWSMTIVVLSGVFGRYLYAHIPKSINGQFVSLQRLKHEESQLIESITSQSLLSPSAIAAAIGSQEHRKPRGFLHAVFLAVRHDLTKRSRRRRLKRLLVQSDVPVYLRRRAASLLYQQATLHQQLVLLQPFQQLFKLWHIIHLPLAILMFVIMIGHIGVAILFGYAWAF